MLAPAPQDAGDTVNFRITYSNPAGLPNTTAFEARLTDTLDANLVLNLASINVTLAGGAAGVTDASGGNTVDVTVDSVPAGGSVQIDFTATVVNNVLVGVIIPNRAELVYTSLPGPNGTSPNPTGSTAPGAPGTATGERTGADGVGGLNDYVDTASVDINLTDPVLSKTISSTSVASTASGEFDISIVDLVVGEEVTFGVTATLPEGTAVPLRLTDTLPTIPAGVLRAVSASIVSIGSQISTSIVPTITLSDGPDPDALDDQVVFDFGDATNAPDGVVNDADRITVRVRGAGGERGREPERRPPDEHRHADLQRRDAQRDGRRGDRRARVGDHQAGR